MEFFEMIKEFIKPELIILIPVIYFIGIGFKKDTNINNKHIPIILGTISIALCTVYIFATSEINNYKNLLLLIFTAITQGVLAAGVSVYINQIVKQSKK